MSNSSTAEGPSAATAHRRCRRAYEPRARQWRVRAAGAVLALVCAACSDQQSEPANTQPDAQHQPPEGSAAAPGGLSGAPAAAEPKVSDLGPVWAEVFWGSYLRDSLWVESSFSAPRPFGRPLGPGERFSRAYSGARIGADEHSFEFLDESGHVVESIPIVMEFGGAFFLEGEVEPRGTVKHEWYVGVVDAPDYASYRIAATCRVLEAPPYRLPVETWIEDSDSATAAPTSETAAPASDSGAQCGAGSSGRVVVLEVQRSPNPPQVSVEPVRVAGDVVEVTWLATDPDDPGLRHELSYSLDAGGTYRRVPRAVVHMSRTPGPRTHAVPLDLFERSEQARVMIVVSDGTRWAAAQSPVFSAASR